MPITRISHKGKSWPIEEFVAACLDGSCSFPAPVAATILDNAKHYENYGTVSGSQLHNECDASRQFEKLPYTQEISDMFYATFRGSNVHAMIEKCSAKPEFKDWIFERRFFAVLRPDDSIDKLEVPKRKVLTKTGEADDWDKFREICANLVAEGCVILSGQVDTYDVKNQTLVDWKTARSVGEWTSVKQSWQQQMNQYCLVLHVNGYEVKRIRITVMDATQPVVLEAPVPDLATWAGNYLVPRVRYLASLQKYKAEDVAAIIDGEREWPEDFPRPNPNYLCNGGKTGNGHIYCPHKSKCPAWREQDLTAALEASVAKLKEKNQ